MPTMSPPDGHDDRPRRYVPSDFIAEMIACHPKTVRRLAADGKIPAPVEIGGLRRWDLDQVLAALRTR
jgi:hypothetical protein